MSPLKAVARDGSIVLIGTYPPRRCGIATFTCDLYTAFLGFNLSVPPIVVAISDGDGGQFDPDQVACEIRSDRVDDYVDAGRRLSDANVGLVCIQHEFGIFGGEAGSHILRLIEQLSCPVVVTLHTILADPTPKQRAVMHALINSVSALAVMTSKARSLLETVYQAPLERVHIIPHGAPDYPLLESSLSKAALGFADGPLLLTFGLLSQNKGIETVLRALPRIIEKQPNATYVVLGATHPNVRARDGETYRDSLKALAHELGVGHAVLFENTFVDRTLLLNYLSACDVYITPYLNPDQITSGTLAYAVALGRPVVSTPYWHAQEILAEGRGVLVPFNDDKAVSDAIIALLTDDAYRNAIGRRAYASARGTIWQKVGKAYLDLFAGLAPGGVRLSLASP